MKEHKLKRNRRLRSSAPLRSLVREIHLVPNQLVQPFFVVEGKNQKQPVASMPGITRYSVDPLLKEVEGFIKAGGQAGLFFGLPNKKDPLAKEAYALDGILQKAVRNLKKHFPEFLLITDTCLCAYTPHGHCGVVKNGLVDNDATIAWLAKAALAQAAAGADIVAPSDMMDFRVRAIREELDQNGFLNVPILSYAVKYASAFYGPFREAADCAPEFGDRRTYQMDYANKREALKEAQQDIEEGADIVMVKPAAAYLDIISFLKENVSVPVAAYSVSGEYSMIKAATQKKWLNEREIVLESLTGIKRAGADIIITYYAREAVGWLSRDQ